MHTAQALDVGVHGARGVGDKTGDEDEGGGAVGAEDVAVRAELGGDLGGEGGGGRGGEGGAGEVEDVDGGVVDGLGGAECAVLEGDAGGGVGARFGALGGGRGNVAAGEERGRVLVVVAEEVVVAHLDDEVEVWLAVTESDGYGGRLGTDLDITVLFFSVPRLAKTVDSRMHMVWIFY